MLESYWDTPSLTLLKVKCPLRQCRGYPIYSTGSGTGTVVVPSQTSAPSGRDLDPFYGWEIGWTLVVFEP